MCSRPLELAIILTLRYATLRHLLPPRCLDGTSASILAWRSQWLTLRSAGQADTFAPTWGIWAVSPSIIRSGLRSQAGPQRVCQQTSPATLPASAYYGTLQYSTKCFPGWHGTHHVHVLDFQGSRACACNRYGEWRLHASPDTASRREP